MSEPGRADEVAAEVKERWRRADPLLPSPAAPGGPHCGAPLTVSDEQGRTVAAGRCLHWAGEPGSLDLSWGAARRFQLFASVAGPDVTDELDRLLTRWREHLADLPETGDPDTAAVINWPSRDADGIAALLRHGLAPLEVLGARTRPRTSGAGWPATPSSAARDPRLRIRRAGPADAGVIARLGLELIRWDTRFGLVNERPDTLDALVPEVAALLDGPDPWSWLAERDGEPAAMLAAQRPGQAQWVAPLTGLSPAAYLMLMFVDPGERGSGVGTALVDEFHRTADAAGVAVTLLHYEQLNPLSVPFWNRAGYRPLWTTWQAVPATWMR